ncbi:uncharacterized protein METZ01_LOCUS151596, partial [marine metagenome]
HPGRSWRPYGARINMRRINVQAAIP